MSCPICDQKPMNCDCTEAEKRQWSEISDMEELVDHLYAKIALLRLTDEEREAVEWFARVGHSDDGGRAATLRALLERTK